MVSLVSLLRLICLYLITSDAACYVGTLGHGLSVQQSLAEIHQFVRNAAYLLSTRAEPATGLEQARLPRS